MSDHDHTPPPATGVMDARRMTRRLKRLLARPGSQRGAGRDLHKPRPDRRDVDRIEVTDEVVIDVFWKILPIGRGPALSLYVLGHEVLKFDCFGAGEGHFHAEFVLPDRAVENRIFLGEPTVAAQIDRTLYELEHNVGYYLQRHPNADVRACRFPEAAVAKLVPGLRERMLEYQRRVQAADGIGRTA